MKSSFIFLCISHLMVNVHREYTSLKVLTGYQKRKREINSSPGDLSLL